MNVFGLLTEYQHGYKKLHSTQSAISAHICNVLDNIIINKPTFSLYLDYKKAFDTVSHLILIQKISDFGLSLKGTVCETGGEWMLWFLTVPLAGSLHAYYTI